MTGRPEDPGRDASGRRAPGEPEPSEEALRRLEERLDRASEVAERLIVEAAARVAQGSEPVADPAGSEPAAAGSPGADAPKPPPAGWQARQGSADGASATPTRGDLDLLLQILGALRDRIPPELQHRLGQALREVLLAIRALIDWYLERTERPRSQSVQVEDIPII